MQTLEGTAAFIHGGPFANIAHGCNSVLATKMAMTVSDYAITEAGFGADLGAEKFMDIKCRKAGLHPSATVLVATLRGLRLHGGIKEGATPQEATQAMIKGFENLDKHVKNMQAFGQPVIVTLNRYGDDSQEDISLLAEHCKELGVGFAANDVFAKGGNGAKELAQVLVDTIERQGAKKVNFVYDDNDTITEKIEKVCKNIYGAKAIVMGKNAKKKLERIKSWGMESLPVCIAKTQYSFSEDPTRYGVAKDFEINIRDLVINGASEMIVAIAGDIMRMPGLPKVPQAQHIDLINGEIEGLA